LYEKDVPVVYGMLYCGFLRVRQDGTYQTRAGKSAGGTERAAK
jgi:hypothetical protein